MQKRVYEKKLLNKLIVVNKPIFISSNAYLNKIKRKYKNKKAGFSGTLDPFAQGCLVVAFGQYSKLFNYFSKTPKKYKAVIWLGVSSKSLDIENIESISSSQVLDENKIVNEIENLCGVHEYYPPKFSAKKIAGKRAYDLARNGDDFEMKKTKMNIHSTKFIKYNHPFITFEATVSEGAYIRSLAQILLKKLDSIGTLSYLQRICEGKFVYENEKDLNPLDYIDIPKNRYFGEKSFFENGKKISINYLENHTNGKYIVEFEDFFSIIEVIDEEVKYILNKVEKCHK